MKHEKTLALLAGLSIACATSQAQIAVGENLTISGFLDASYSQTEHDSAHTGSKDKTLGVDQVEVDFDLSFDGASASVHLESKGGEVSLEQAYASINVSGVTLTGGRMLNLLGFESDEPTGLLQYSNAYSFGDASSTGFDLGRQYSDGVRGAVSQGDFSAAASVLSSLYADKTNDDEVAFEVSASYTGIENLTVSLGYADDNNSSIKNNGVLRNSNVVANILNLHASYSLGQVTVHGEVNDFEDERGKSGSSYLLAGTYSINDKAGITVRYSEVDAAGTKSDLDKFTISPNYALTDNLNTRFEYSTGEFGGKDVDVVAVEGILSF